jgi:O-antigen ligase
VPFFAIILVWAFLPYARTPFYSWAGVPFKGTDVLLFVLLLVVALGRNGRPQNRIVRNSCRPLLKGVFVSLGYAALTMLWADLTKPDQIGMGYTLLGALVCFLIPYLGFVCFQRDQIYSFLWRLSAALAIISFCYVAEPFLGLGLRGTPNELEVMIFGMQRAAGPLLHPANGHFQLLPAVGFVLGDMLVGRGRRPVSIVLLFMLVAFLLGSGSRSALISLGLFIALVALSTPGKAKVIAIYALLVLIAISAAVLLTKASPDRLTKRDAGREETYRTAAAIFESQTLAERVMGSGYGHWWPWYIIDVEGGGAYATGRFVLPTPYGPTYYNPHSLFLIGWVELGIAGVCMFLALIIFLLRLPLKQRRQAETHVFLCSLAAQVPAFFSDCYLVKNVEQSLLWWCFVLGAVALSARQIRVSREEHPCTEPVRMRA